MRNWDYRYCWLRDATFTLYALLLGGYHATRPRAWRDWLLRAVAGDPAQLQIMYGVAGERRLTELELDWLPGYEGSRPVRIGNAAVKQLQLDVYGEVMDALHQARERLASTPIDVVARCRTRCSTSSRRSWQRARRGHLGGARAAPALHALEGDGVGRVRSRGQGRRALRLRRPGRALARSCATRSTTRSARAAFDAERGAFTQSYGSTRARRQPADDAAGRLPAAATIRACVGTVRGDRARADARRLRAALPHARPTVDGLPPGEGVFLPCSFWLADNYALLGAHDEARALFERLLALRNDVGLLSEEYDPRSAPAARQLPAGVLARRADQHGLQPGLTANESDAGAASVLAAGR